MRITYLAPLLVAVPGIAWAEPLTFDQALAAAAADQPLLQAGQLQVEARRDSAEAAGQLPDPKLETGIENLPVTGPNVLNPDMMTMFKVGVSQDIPNPAKRRAQTGLAGSQVGVAEARLGLTTRQLRVAAGSAWIDLAYAQRRLELAKQTSGELNALVPAANSAVASGSVRPAEALAIRRSLVELDSTIAGLEAERDTARAKLARFVPASEPVASGPAPSAMIEPEQFRTALPGNPALLLSDAELRQADAQARVAEAERRPDFGVSVSYGVRERRYGDMLSVMGSITLPIFQGRRQQPRIAAAEAEASAARLELEDQRRQLVAQFETDAASWRSAYRQWQNAEHGMHMLESERVALETASYAAGRASLADVIDAKVGLAMHELEILAREAEAVKAASLLRLTYGEDVQ
jgi:outer membrane protein TolC